MIRKSKEELSVLVIIPAYNEELNIYNTVLDLKKKCPNYDYVIINDCSKDNTLKVLKDNCFSYINLPTNLGIGGAVQCGYMYAAENGYDIAIQMDGDGQHDPKYYPEAVKLIEDDEADIVIGSRFITNEGFQTSFMRRFGIRFLSGLINLMCHEKVKDVTSGYRVVNRKYLELFAKEYAQDYPEPEAIIAAKLKNARIREIPVVMREREKGESSISPLKSIVYMIKVSLAIIFSRMTIKRS